MRPIGPATLGAALTLRVATPVATSDPTAAPHAAPVLDGRLDDPVWASADVATDFRQFEPSPGACATERTEARVFVNGEALYVAMRMFDPHPDSIRAQFLRRDDGGPSADWAAVILDSYHDRRTAYRFATTPRGSRTDVLHFNDSGADSTWDAVWDVVTAMDSLGWTAEFRIPLSQLRFSAGEDLVWGVNFARTIGRRAEQSYWAPVLPTEGRFVSVMGELRDLRIPGGSRPLELLPYTVGRLTSDPTVAGNPLRDRNETWSSVGLDLKYGLTSNFTLTATVNPDFGQVDADPAVVNLSAFESFYPERRPFFTEGTQIFDFPLVPEGYAFYSRRIGRAPQLSVSAPAGGFADVPGNATILGAAKLTGKTAGGTSLGLITAVTDDVSARTITALGVRSSTPIEPTSRFLVARASKDLRQGRSGFGAMMTATDRDVSDSAFRTLRSSAITGGLNAFHRLRGNQYQLTGWVYGTDVRGSATAISATQRSSVHYYQRPDAEGYDFDSTRTSLSGAAGEVYLARISGRRLTWNAGGGFRSSGFEANDVGFVSYTDVWYTSVDARYRVSQPREFIRDWWVEGSATRARSFGGQLLRPSGLIRTNTQFRNFWSLNTSTDRWNAYLWPWELRGGPALLKSGYTNVTVALTTDSRRSWRLRARGRVQRSDELGGSIVGFDPSLVFRPNTRSTITLTPSWTHNLAAAQYVTSATPVGGAREYFVAQLDQTTVSMTARISYALTPLMTLDVYAEPFLSGGVYSRYRRVAAPKARSVGTRIPLVAPTALTFDAGLNRYAVDLDGDATPDLSFKNPDFNRRSLRTNSVIRWEFRPGSTIYLVWAQTKDESIVRPFDLAEDASALFRAQSRNVLMLKVAWWIDR